MAEIKVFKLGYLDTNTTVIKDGEVSLIFDPAYPSEQLLSFVSECKKKLVFFTHNHLDHILGVFDFFDNAQLYFPKIDLDDITPPYVNSMMSLVDLDDELLKQIDLNKKISEFLNKKDKFIKIDKSFNENLPFDFKVIFTPGHTRGSISYYSKDLSLLISGDTLFYHTYGRTDLFGGSETDMLESLKKLLSLDGNTRVIPGHGYETSILKEKLYFSSIT